MKRDPRDGFLDSEKSGGMPKPGEPLPKSGVVHNLAGLTPEENEAQTMAHIEAFIEANSRDAVETWGTVEEFRKALGLSPERFEALIKAPPTGYIRPRKPQKPDKTE